MQLVNVLSDFKLVRSAPPGAKRVLCYGRDALLLRTRRLILEQAGHTSETAGDDSEYQAKLQVFRPDVIVFCHTLSGDECSKASRFAAGCCPRSRLLVLFHHFEHCIPQEKHVLMDSADGPAAFSRRVADLLKSGRALSFSLPRKAVILAVLRTT